MATLNTTAPSPKEEGKSLVKPEMPTEEMAAPNMHTIAASFDPSVTAVTIGSR